MNNVREKFQEKMKKAGIDQRVAELFMTYYNTLTSGNYGIIPEKDISAVPYGSLPRLADLTPRTASSELLKKTVVIKLNGGLGTSMGLTGPKSFLPVKCDKRFIDIVIDQIAYLQKTTGEAIPLLLMNSSVTNEDTTELLKKNSHIAVNDLPASFVHNSYPKVLVKDFTPASLPGFKNAEWNPAGHGDIYTALLTTGILDTLLEKEYEYAFISNIDNLGATLDTTLLTYFAERFLMEVVQRREMDKKGGHIARDSSGNLILRERAQAADDEIDQFESIENYAYFNSNSIWINLKQLKKIADEKGQIELPLIANRKNLIPTDRTTPEVFQIETAMGSAISLFAGAEAIEIEQNRFRPVKKNNDLLLLWSDRYELNQKCELQEVVDATQSINVQLDERYFTSYPDLEDRVGSTVPSLKDCTTLIVQGDVAFGERVQVTGDVVIRNTRSTQFFVENMKLKNQTLSF